MTLHSLLATAAAVILTAGCTDAPLATAPATPPDAPSASHAPSATLVPECGSTLEYGQNTIYVGPFAIECLVYVYPSNDPYSINEYPFYQFPYIGFGANFNWTSSNPAVISVSQDGYVTAHQPGYAWITASDEQSTGSVRVDAYPWPY